MFGLECRVKQGGYQVVPVQLVQPQEEVTGIFGMGNPPFGGVGDPSDVSGREAFQAFDDFFDSQAVDLFHDVLWLPDTGSPQ